MMKKIVLDLFTKTNKGSDANNQSHKLKMFHVEQNLDKRS